MDLDMINRELEKLLSQIKSIKKESEIDSTLSRIGELRAAAFNRNNTEAKNEKSQDVRTFENLEAVYKGLKDRTETLRSAGRLETDINDNNSMEHKISYQYNEVYRKSIDKKKLKVLEEFKDRYSEAELSRVLQEEIDWRKSRVEQQEREIEERDEILVAADKREIDEYDRSKTIVNQMNVINDAKNKIETARTAIEAAKAEINAIKADNTKTDDEKKALIKAQNAIKQQNNKIISNQLAVISKFQTSLSDEYNVVGADGLLDENGNLNEELLDSISRNAQEDLEHSVGIIKSNLERFVNRNMGSRQSMKDIEKFIGNIPNDFDSLSLDETEKILEKLRRLKKDTDSKSTHIHTLKTKIDEIETFLDKQAKENNAIAGKGKMGSNGVTRYGFRTAKEYRDSGIELDPVFREKTFSERRRDKMDFILQTLPQDVPFRKLRAWIRSFSPRAGYALSEAKLARETQYRRKEEVFKSSLEAYKAGAPSTEAARVIGMKNVRTDKLSGKKKAQMEEREID